MMRIVVGFDGSEGAREALVWAAGAARALELPLHVLSAWKQPSDAVVAFEPGTLPSVEEAQRLVEVRLRAAVDEIIRDEPLEVSTEVVRRSAVRALLGAAADAAMVVVGSRGLGGFRGLLVGSVSRQVCEYAPCPVTVIHRVGDRPVRPRTVVVGVDGSEDAQRALEFAADLVARTGAQLVVANATGPHDPPEPAAIPQAVDLAARRAWVEEWCEPLREAGIAYHVAVLRGDPRTALLDAARDRDADLIVVGSRGRGRIATLLLGSVATALAQQGTIPVTIVPHAGRGDIVPLM